MCPSASSILYVGLIINLYCVYAQNSCQTSLNKTGTCISHKECPSFLGKSQKVSVSEKFSQCGHKKGKFVCCPNTNTTISSFDREDALKLLPSGEKCGVVRNDRIIGAESTRIDEFPWLALIQYSDVHTGQLSFNCEGSLINSRYVITSGHCVHATNLMIPGRYKPISVRLGVLDCKDKSCLHEPVQNIRIEQIITNSDYKISDVSVHNDIALLRMHRRASYTYFVRPVCLPITEKLRITSQSEVLFTVVGWEQLGNRTKTNVKMKSKLKLVPIEQCQQVFPKRIIWYKQLCAGGTTKKKSCNGDSGRPLMQEVQEGVLRYWYMAGIFSFGSRACGLENVPEVYTNVDEYLEWILRNIRP